VKIVHFIELDSVLFCEGGRDFFRSGEVPSFEMSEYKDPLVLAMCKIVLHFFVFIFSLTGQQALSTYKVSVGY
jgi:hypothetical protein